jgi:hypothetical protein
MDYNDENIHQDGPSDSIGGMDGGLGLNEVAREMNQRPRKTLVYETPAERFDACVAMTT